MRKSTFVMPALVISAIAITGTPLRADCTVHAFGQVMYVDEEGNKKPLPHIRVKLMDQDSDFDEEMDHGFADANGFFDLKGKGGDSVCVGKHCKRPDAYVKFILQADDRLEIESPMWATRWSMTKVREDKCGEWDMGQRVFSKHYPEDRAARLWAWTDSAYRIFSAHTDRKPEGNSGEVAVEIPTVLTAGTPYTTWDTIHWPGHRSVSNTVYHEFGHRLRHAADGGVDHFNQDALKYWYPRNHDPSDRTNEGFAFNEGWADYTRYVFNNGRAVDKPAQATMPSVKGDDVQGDVAWKLAALSNQCGGFRRMYDTLRTHPGQIHSYGQFHAAFMSDYPLCGKKLINLEPGKPDKDAPKIPPSDLNRFRLQKDWVSITPEMHSLLSKELEDVRQRVSNARVQKSPYVPPMLPSNLRFVVEDLHSKRLALKKSWGDDAVAAYQKLLLNPLRMTEESFKDGSHARARLAARDEFVTRIAAPRLREMEGLRRHIAAQKGKSSDPTLQAYLTRLDAKYARAEREFKDALQSRGTGARRVPLEILPNELGAQAEEQK